MDIWIFSSPYDQSTALHKTSYFCRVDMKKIVVTVFLLIALIASPRLTWSQCSICTKTAQQLGEKPAKALNSAIIYLMLTPFGIIGYVGYRWWKSNRDS